MLRGYGVAVLPYYMVKDHLDAGDLVRLLPDVPLLEDSFRLLYRADSPHTDAFGDLAGFLRERPLT